jgi:hypothetical protein
VLRHMEHRRHLRGLATNPLMCAMLCALNLDRRKQLPPDRMRLYGEALQLLIDRRDAERDIPAFEDLVLDPSAKVGILQHLAWRLSLAGRSELSRKDAVEHISRALKNMPNVSAPAETVLTYLLERSGAIREPLSGRIDFVHRTFQEYLAAKECAEDHLIDTVVSLAHKDQWRETIVMTAGHATGPRREELMDGILSRARQEPRHARRLKLLAAACLETVHTMPSRITEEIDEALSELLPPRVQREARSIAMAGSRALDLLPNSLGGLPPAAASACVWTAAFINGPAALGKLTSFSSDPRWEVQASLLDVWKFFDAGEFADKVLAEAPLMRWEGGAGSAYVGSIEHLPLLTRLKNLKSVDLRLAPGEELNDYSVLRNVPYLRSVELWATRPLDCAYFTGLESLNSLSVHGAGIDRGFPALKTLSSLTALSLTLPHAGGDWIGTVRELHAVNNLQISRAKMPGRLRALGPILQGLRRLRLADCPNVTHLQPLQENRIESLQLSSCPVTSLEPIADMPRLAFLGLTDLGSLDLSPVNKAPGLGSLLLFGPEEVDFGWLQGRQAPLRLYLRRAYRHLYRGLDQLPGHVTVKYH